MPSTVRSRWSTRLALPRDNWGGGTSIGESLRALLRRHGDRHVGAGTLVVSVSDGLDVGAPEALRESMRRLHSRAAGVVWLNPLLETPGYRPASRGMVAARPFITTFASVHMAGDLARLAHAARRGRLVIGFIVSRIGADEAEILSVALAPAERGRGLARNLLMTHLGYLAAEGVRTVFLEVEEANAPARALYQRAGFADVGRREGYYAANGAAAVVMRRDIV